MSKTIKAYMSEAGSHYVDRLSDCGCNSILPCEHDEAKALDELSRILADVEPESERSYYSGEPFGGHQNDGTLGGTADILAESLAAFVADGGPCDELAVRSMLSAGPAGLTVFLRNQPQPDPVILAGQRDLAVLQAYAESRQ